MRIYLPWRHAECSARDFEGAKQQILFREIALQRVEETEKLRNSYKKMKKVKKFS